LREDNFCGRPTQPPEAAPDPDQQIRLVGVQLAISDAHPGLEAALAKVRGSALAALHRPLPARSALSRSQGRAASSSASRQSVTTLPSFFGVRTSAT
jgi:hypothetical protein